MSSTDQTKLEMYLLNGGSLYLEGADVAEHLNGTTLFDYFGASYINSGLGLDFNDLIGLDDTPASSVYFDYNGGSDAHYSIDALDAQEGEIFLKSDDEKGRVIGNETAVYKTIMSSPVIGALKDGVDLNLKAYLMGQYIDFLNTGGTAAGNGEITPIIVSLKQNYPNPFNPSTIIDFSLSENQPVLLDIFNLKGQKIRSLANEILTSGSHRFIWDGTDEQRKPVSSGIYLYRLQVAGKSLTRKMVLAK
ncbi:MAG: T9SS type A sorting domain-containing protein [Candidatus Cloacimonetes bacterium]|nr:T9SS type A sorting domain-containing protein [Candidatus Cloacimonadota bacterium]